MQRNVRQLTPNTLKILAQSHAYGRVIARHETLLRCDWGCNLQVCDLGSGKTLTLFVNRMDYYDHDCSTF